MAFTHTEKVKIGSFIRARIRIWIQSQTSGSGCGSATLPTGVPKQISIKECKDKIDEVLQI
jgi:hypothetical protein